MAKQSNKELGEALKKSEAKYEKLLELTRLAEVMCICSNGGAESGDGTCSCPDGALSKVPEPYKKTRLTEDNA